MLSTSVIRNVTDASHYYSSSDNYYTREEGVEQSEWIGKGAEKMGLFGEVNAEKFTALLAGKLPNGELLGKVVDDKVIHRAGWDLTFSAPKSVSILALIGGDKRLIEAHRQAAKVALSHIEQACSQARIKTGGEVQFQNTGNIIAALYHHDLSRAQDPQLHTHSVVMNMTERQDGKWRSQASKMGRYDGDSPKEINGFIERARHNKRYFGKLYEAELAFQVKELGYDIVVNEKTGVFEIAGIPEAVKTFFSKRRNQVELALKEKGLSSPKAAEIATQNTREDKTIVDREILSKEWKQETDRLGFSCQTVIDRALTKNKSDLIPEYNVVIPEIRAMKAVLQATQSLSRFKTTFTLEEIVTSAICHGLHEPLSVQSVLTALHESRESGNLVIIEEGEGKTVFMAKSTIDDEKRLFTQLENKKLGEHLIDPLKIDAYVQKNVHINAENAEHLKTLFNDDRVIFLEGQSTKDMLIESIVGFSKAEKLEIAVLSPNQIGSKQVAKEITPKPVTAWEHIKSLFVDNTIKNYGAMQFIAQFSGDKPITVPIPDVIIVDNAHLLSTHQKANIVEWNVLNETKLILLGDTKTLLPQQTGTSIQQIVTHGVTTISCPDNQNKDKKLSDNEFISQTLQRLSNNVVSVPQTEDRLHAMAVHYSKMNMQERQKSWLTAHQKSTISLLNTLVHDELKKTNQLGKSITTPILIPVFIPEGKAFHASSYLKDHKVRFNENYPSLSVARGEYLRIIEHNKEKNTVLLENAKGKKIRWHPDKVAGTQSGKVELFSETNREIAVGESIVFQRSVKQLGVVKGERLTISDIYTTSVKLKDSSGKSVNLDLKLPQHRHLDYGYAGTLHAIAHEKPHTLIAELPTQSFGTNQRHFYQVASQPENTWIYTDDIKGFANYMEKKTGDKLGAHDVLLKSDEAKKNMRDLYQILEKQIINCSEKNQYSPLSRPAVEAIDYAIHHLAERDAGFTHKQIIETAMHHALGNVRPADLNRAVVAVEKAGILLRGTRNDGTLWTTLEAVKIEREIIALCQKDQGTLEPIASDSLLEKYCDPSRLKPEQIEAVKAITQSKDRIIAIQGYAGTGKTTMLATVADVLASKNILEEGGYGILTLAPTNKAVSQLKKHGLPSKTLDSFIVETQKNKERGVVADRKLMLVIDESSMLSNRKALEALNIAFALDCRVIPVGDVRQLPSIEAGKPFDLIQTKVETKLLADIQRQKDTTLKQAVAHTINYDFKAAFDTLKNSITEVNEQTHPMDKNFDKKDWEGSRTALRDTRLNMLVSDYFSFPKEEEGNIQIITPGHDDRILVNDKIREQFKMRGRLQENGDHSFDILSSASFTQIERSQVSNFEKGDVLRFGKSEAVGIKAGEYLTILNTEHQHQLLTLENNEGRTFVWQVPKFDKDRLSHVEVFKKERRALQAGDMIRWSRSDKKNELFSTEPAHVISVEKDRVTVTLANEKQLTFNPNDSKYKHWDHGYAATVYAVQADTKNIVLAHLESFRPNLTSQPTFLVELTRAVNVFRLYTDNVEALLKTVEQNHGVKLSSLEVIGEYPALLSPSKESKPFKSMTQSVPYQPQTQSVFSKAINPKIQPNLASSAEISPYFNRETVSQIKDGLNKNAELIATEFLGTPVERGGHYLKFGTHQGSLSVTTKGEKQGWFNDFETNKGGRDMLKFIQVHGGMDRQKSLEHGARWLGIIPDNDNVKTKIKVRDAQKKAERIIEKSGLPFSDYEKKRIQFANKLATESQRIKGTLAEKYLKEHRGIDTQSLSKNIRFHPGIYAKQNQKSLPALLSIARTSDGKVQSVEAIFLNPKTADRADVALKKQTIGPKKGAAVVLHVGEKNAPTLIAEGVVTGLSLANALPKSRVVVVLGKQLFSSVDPAVLSGKVIFCLDNDGKNLKMDALILAAASRLKEQQKTVSFMVPEGLKTAKQDYNDILKHQGKESIQRDYSRAISYEEFYKNDKQIEGKIPHPPVKSPQISDRQLGQFIKETQGEGPQASRINLDFSPEIRLERQHKEIPKSISHIREIER